MLDLRMATRTITTSKGHTGTAQHVIMATHTPLGRNLVLHTQVAPYRSYVLGVRINGTIPDALFWDTAEPYHYIRKFNGPAGEILIIGGRDHKTAHGDEQDHFRQLEEYARSHFDITEIMYRWSSQLYEPADQLPMIGKNPLGSNIYVATGYSGNGLTFGTLAGMMNSDLILGKSTPYSELYSPSRFNLSSMPHLISENIDVARRFI